MIGILERPVDLTPDGHRYLASKTARQKATFHYRWLIPYLCGNSKPRWFVSTYGSAVLLAVAAFFYAGPSWKACLMPVLALGLSGVTFQLKRPILVDLPAMALALSSAALWVHGWYVPAVLVVLVVGMVKEPAPAFAAAYAWTPWLLVGYIPTALRALWKSGDDVLNEENRWILDHPLKASWKYHRAFPLWVFVLPWGALLLGMVDPSPQVLVALALGYGSCVLATDTVRLYQYAWPVLAVHFLAFVPAAWLLPVLAVHLANPFKTEGG